MTLNLTWGDGTLSSKNRAISGSVVVIVIKIEHQLFLPILSSRSKSLKTNLDFVPMITGYLCFARISRHCLVFLNCDSAGW